MTSVQEEYEQRSLRDEEFETRIADKIFNRMKGYITAEVKETLEASRDDIVQSTADAYGSSLKELSRDAAKDQRRLTLKRKGNQNQLEHEVAVRDEMDRVKEALASNDIQKAAMRLEKGTLLVTKRIKTIKLADREELGWRVIQHYESDALADDSEDEKMIEKARRAAKAEAKESEAKRSRSLGKSSPYHPPSRPFLPRNSRDGGRPKKDIQCFGCNKFGHMKKDCFHIKNRRTSKY